MNARVVIACGGTGGHLFPGIAIAECLLDRGHDPLLVISEKEIDAIAIRSHEHLKYVSLPSIGMPKVYSPRMLNFVFRYIKSYFYCKNVIKEFEADAVLGMGGFTSLPALMAGQGMGVKTFIHESNAYPGKANRVAARWADIVLLGMEACRQHFPGKNVKVVGTPLRGVMRKSYDRNQAIEHFNLSSEKKTLLILGGSQGAYGINSVITDSLTDLKDLGVQIIHLTGPADYDRVSPLYEGVDIDSHIAPFCDCMQLAYASCDIAIARSGASSLAELSAFGIPSILVPYPYATDDHQTLNAVVYSDAGASLMRQESEMSSSALISSLSQLLDSNNEVYKQMSFAMRKMAVIDAAENICEQILVNSK